VTSIADTVRSELRAAGDPERARGTARFFKAGPGGYADGDRFLGVPVPVQRRIARRYAREVTLDDVALLLRGGWHEERLTALLILVERFRRAPAGERAEIVQLYLANTARVNNWDLVDSSAPYLLGQWLLGSAGAAGSGDRIPAGAPGAGPEMSPGAGPEILHRLAGSSLVWDRRIAMLATFAFVRAGDNGPTLALAERLVDDPHDLVRKAVGWMLREVGNRDREAAERFLREHCRTMPRVALRYAIEKFPPELRRAYLDGTV